MMENYITVISFVYPHEAHMAKNKLESEGIEVNIRDELTVQVYNFYSNAIGGVKLQVKESDVEVALQILKDGDYIREEQEPSSEFIEKINKLTGKIPLLRKLNVFLRLLIIIVLIISAIAISLAFILLPSKAELLTGNNWCIREFEYAGENLYPNTVDDGIWIVFTDCEDEINFHKNGIAEFPGFDSPIFYGYWELHKNKLTITCLKDPGYPMPDSTHSFTKSLYPGTYKLKIMNNRLQMKSDNVNIIAEPLICW